MQTHGSRRTLTIIMLLTVMLSLWTGNASPASAQQAGVQQNRADTTALADPDTALTSNSLPSLTGSSDPFAPRVFSSTFCGDGGTNAYYGNIYGYNAYVYAYYAYYYTGSTYSYYAYSYLYNAYYYS